MKLLCVILIFLYFVHSFDNGSKNFEIKFSEFGKFSESVDLLLKTFNEPLNTDEEDENSPCIIKVNDLPNKHPNFIQSFDIIIPLKGLLIFQKKESFQVDCVQSKFSNGFSIKTIVCDGNNKYKINGRTVGLSDFNTCKERIKVKEVTSKPCLGGVMTNMVFKLPQGDFKLYSSCSDLKSLSTHYVHYKIYGRAFDGSPMVRSGSNVQGGNNFDALYKKNKDYHKGHLMPYADAIYPAWRAETNNYINIKPQNPTLNSGAWSSLESNIKSKAIETSETFDVYTGGFNSKGFLDDSKKLVEIHTFWYKMVIDNIRGIVFVGCNDDKSSCHTQFSAQNFFTKECRKLGWFRKKRMNKIICCSIADFYERVKIAVIPGTEKVTEVMFFYQDEPRR